MGSREGGTAIADIILGKVNPSGKLAQAWLRSPGAVNSPANPWFQPPNPGGGNPPFHNSWRVNGDKVPVSPLFPMVRATAGLYLPYVECQLKCSTAGTPQGYGLSYTTFAFEHASVDSSGVPPAGLNGTQLVNTTLKLKVTVSNTGKVRGSTPVIVTFGKLTRGVVRYIRMIAAFTKINLSPGHSKSLSIPVRVSDLARYDTEIEWRDLQGTPVRGAYVVDAGEYTLFVGDCVDNSGITKYPGGVNATYTPCEPLNATVTLGQACSKPGPPPIYGVYL